MICFLITIGIGGVLMLVIWAIVEWMANNPIDGDYP